MEGQYYYVKSGGKQYTLVEASFTAANFCQDNPDRKVLENQYIKILALTHSQVQMYMMPNRKDYPPPVVLELDRHLQILLDILHGKLLPDGETEVVASGMTTYFQQRAKLVTRDGNAIDDPTTEAWKVFYEDESKLTSAQRALLEEDYSYQITMAFKELDSHGGIISKVSEESRAVLVKNPFYKSMDKALTENAKTIEQMKEDRSNYVLVGKENVFHIPASKKTVYKYVWTLRHLAKDNWKRLKFEQAAGISLFEMEKAYSQLSMKKQCAPKNIDKRLEQEEIIRALAEKNSSAQKTQEEVVDKSVKKCVKCGMEKKRWNYLIEEWDKLEDNERVCQVCTKAEKEGKQIARFDPAVRRELDQAVRRLEEKQAAEKMRLEQEKKAAAEVQSRLSAHKQMEQLERVAISVVRPSKEVELGLGVGKRDDRMTVTSIAPGIFDGSQLERGMIIDSVNGSCPLSFKDALHTLQNAEGRINIVALSRV